MKGSTLKQRLEFRRQRTRAAMTLFWMLPAIVLATRANADDPYALIINPDASVDIANISIHAFQVEGYRINSFSRAIVSDAWDSIHDQYQRDPAVVESWFGPDFPKEEFPFGEFIVPDPTADIGEVLPLIDWPNGLRVPIGKPFGNDVNAIRMLVEQEDLNFGIGIGIDFTTNLPILFEIPEPSTLMLLLMAAPLFLAGFVRFRWTRTIHP